MHRIQNWIVVLAVCIPVVAFAQVNNPADKARGMSEREASERASHLRSWELPAVHITGDRIRKLREEERIGTYAQPRWSARRLFSETRVYVRPEGQLEFEYWSQPEVSKDDERSVRTMYEWEFGLPNRFQLDLYLVAHQTGNDGPLTFDEQKVELRWAFANWGVIPGNPTAYLEWSAINDESDKLEGKILLGGEMMPRVHWGTNFVYETQIRAEKDAEREAEMALTGGISYAVTDEKFAAGAELKIAHEGESTSVLLGPTVQVRPLVQMHIDVAPLVGIGSDSPKLAATAVAGWEF